MAMHRSDAATATLKAIAKSRSQLPRSAVLSGRRQAKPAAS